LTLPVIVPGLVCPKLVAVIDVKRKLRKMEALRCLIALS